MVTKLHSSANLDLYSASGDNETEIPLIGGVKAGFPSPAQDFIAQAIDLNKYIIKHPAATYFALVNGVSMDTDLSEGDLLVVDRSLDPQDGKIAVCFVDGEFTVKKIRIEKDRCLLVPSNPDYPVIEVNKDNDFTIWGIVTYVIKKV
ncbi:MAG: translesion error-prone DNA polymerase V autoproteolytic subunit [Parabacteroides sp.]|jgi:DNA polymerase V|uniref:LexA family protein n=1 Tax=Macellibacteroides TaxID=1159323 RepID=UPI000830181B|nr:translesion error-prone DNA polymerase V autoproteolytic subunit [Parabacteroides sp.]MEA4810464.1 translesion error-prone DNA polymerase V autoproteolytic subunit [Macellibacteroides fermentans]OCW92963.1 peptidase S24 [Macellibacteroides sp. HH-ZS]HAD02065.1 peptidase S24 [Porphyromonadaceae bacterium]MBP7939254.1 translesion error-prone DNA polymerase V autoproteolytic subunit [Parabacteroides sp.]